MSRYQSHARLFVDSTETGDKNSESFKKKEGEWLWWCNPRLLRTGFAAQTLNSLAFLLLTESRLYTSAGAITVYIPPSDNAEAACDVSPTLQTPTPCLIPVRTPLSPTRTITHHLPSDTHQRCHRGTMLSFVFTTYTEDFSTPLSHATPFGCYGHSGMH